MSSYVAGIKFALYENDRNASFKTSNSVHGTIKPNGFIIEANKNIMALETGRRSGKQPPIAVIVDWIQLRGIVPEERNGVTPSIDALAFIIARKIGRDGFEGTPNIISQVTGDLDRIDRLGDDVAEYYVQQISKSLDNGIDNINKA